MPRFWPFGHKTASDTKSLRHAAPAGNAMHPDLGPHFALIEQLRNTPAAEQESIAEEMVRYAPQAIRGFMAEYQERRRFRESPDAYASLPPMKPFALPSHPGFQRLAMNAEKAKDYDRAIRLCEEAKRQGWSGDWDVRIARCRSKSRQRT
ncbi:MAG: hypothetical protein WBA46_17110 [Thermomicrobiales bacterium]